MKRLSEDFKKSVSNRHLDFWFTRNCSMCDYPLGFIFSKENGKVFYDNGCNCIRGRCSRVVERSWEDVANYYNRNLDIIETLEANRFFGFIEYDQDATLQNYASS